MTAARASRWGRLSAIGVERREGVAVTEVVIGVVGIALGFLIGWLLRRDRFEQPVFEAVVRDRDAARARLTKTAARLESADHDLVELRAELRAAHERLADRADTIDELQYDLAECRDELGIDQTQVMETVVDQEPHGSDDTTEPVRATGADAHAMGPAADGDASVAAPVDDDATVPASVRDGGAEPVDADATVSVGDVGEDGAAHAADAGVTVPASAAADVDADATVRMSAVTMDTTARVPSDASPSDASPTVGDADTATGASGSTTGSSPDGDAAIDGDRDRTVAVPGSHEVDEGTAELRPGDDETMDIRIASGQTQLLDDDAASDDITHEVVLGHTAPEDRDDDLQRIRGIGPKMEQLLNEHGITTFRQLAVLTDAGIDELSASIPRFASRIRRDRWVEQAQRLHSETHGDQR